MLLNIEINRNYCGKEISVKLLDGMTMSFYSVEILKLLREATASDRCDSNIIIGGQYKRLPVDTFDKLVDFIYELQLDEN